MKKKKRMAKTFWISVCLCAGVFLPIAFCEKKASAKVYRDGFTYSKLNVTIRAKMNGVSYRKNPYISYKDLRYIRVKHYDFQGNVVTGELIVNKKIARRTVKIFYELYKIKYPIQRMRLIDEYGGVDEISMAANNSSAFNYRKIAGTNKLSNHALGMAIDINPRINPYITAKRISPSNGKAYANRKKKKCSGKYAELMIQPNDKIVKIFKKYGFSWGGNWKYSKDYQHFEWKR